MAVLIEVGGGNCVGSRSGGEFRVGAERPVALSEQDAHVAQVGLTEHEIEQAVAVQIRKRPPGGDLPRDGGGRDEGIDKPMAPYFVYSSSITAWQPPHEHDPLTQHDKEVVLQAIRDHMNRKGTYYIIDPTDEQYRTL
jgi:hypothetical protein